MRDLFKGYYQPTEAEVEAIWRDGMISLDTNILLSLYNVLPTTSALYLGAMEERKQQMWIPYQVASEFHKNVHKERSKQTALHAARINRIKSLLDDFRSTVKKSRLQPSTLQEQAETALQALKDELDDERKQIAKQTHHHTRDTLLDRIAGVFETGVGPKPTAGELDEMFKEGEKRFDLKTPPGYEDEKDKKDNRKYGDYVLWRQLMDHAVNEKCDMIFVTDDNKADWWLKDEDRKTSLAPRPELVQEFREVTGQEILILNSEQFYYSLVPAADDNSDKSKEVKAAQEDMKAAVIESQFAQLPQSLLKWLEATGHGDEVEQIKDSRVVDRQTLTPSTLQRIAERLQVTEPEDTEPDPPQARSMAIRSAMRAQYRALQDKGAMLAERQARLTNDLRFQNESHKRAILRKRLNSIESEILEVEEKMSELDYRQSLLADEV